MYKLDPPPLLFETSRPGRATALLPPPDVPERAADPARAPRRLGAALARAERARRRPALHEPVDVEHVDRREFLPARLVYDEVQPEAERAARGAAGPGGAAPVPGRGDAPGAAGDPARAPADAG